MKTPLPALPVNNTKEEIINDINVTEKVQAFCTKYYNIYANTTIESTSADFDSDIIYVNVGKVTSNLVSTITINKETYDDTEQLISIGNNGFIKAPLWYVEDGYLYVSIFILGIHTTANSIEISYDTVSKIIEDTNSIPADTLEITEVYALNTQDGYKNEVTTNDDNTEIVQNTEHGLHAIGVIIQDTDGQDILNESIYYLYHSELSMGISTPETMNNTQVTFALYGKYSTEAYTEVEQRIMNNTILIPNEGAAQFRLTVNCMVKE